MAVLVSCCIVRENILLSSSVASILAFGLFQDASEALNSLSWIGHIDWSAVLIGVTMCGGALVIMSLSASAAADISRIPVRESRSSVSELPGRRRVEFFARSFPRCTI